MAERLNILMISHHRRVKSRARPHAMAKYLVQRGHKVTLIVTADERRTGLKEFDWEEVRTIETPDLLWGQLRSGWDPWNIINRTRFLQRDQSPYDLIHCFETRPATIYPALIHRHRRNIPLITDWNDWWGRGGIIDELRPRWYRMMFGRLETYYEENFRNQGAGVTVISTALARRAQGLGIPQERICHVPGGTLPDFFVPRDQATCRRHANLPSSIPIVGFSSLDSHLDLDVVLQSLAIVAARYPDVKLLITGTPPRAVVEKARLLGVEGNLHLTGFLPFEELPWHLGCADLFVLPLPNRIYNVGRWPNKICDYISLGRPTVSNPVGDMKDLFEKHQVGLLAEWTAEDFAGKVLELLDNPAKANELGHNARHAAVTEYNWMLLIERLERFYFQVINSSRQGGKT